MDQYGTKGSEWHITRGNHDNYQPGGTLAYVVGVSSDVPDNFGVLGLPRQQHWAAQAGEIRLIGVDSATVHTDGGLISAPQMDAVRTEIHKDADRPTFLFAHHPITRDAAFSNQGGPLFVVPDNQVQQFQSIVSEGPGTASVFAGHTHRSRRGRADVGNVDYCERGASIGYPGGYTLVDVYQGGYIVSFHRIPTRESLDWSARTRWALLGVEPEVMLGNVFDRNYLVIKDFG